MNGKVKRQIPPKVTLTKRVHSVIDLFRQIDPTFITESVLKKHKHCLHHLNEGCLSDHPDVPLYSKLSESDSRYRCARGSSSQEGFHFYIANAISGKVLSPMLFDAMLVEIVYRWNVDPGSTVSNIQFHCYDLKILSDIYNLFITNDAHIPRILCMVSILLFLNIILSKPSVAYVLLVV